MKILFSHWSLKEPFVEMAALSNYYARLNGYDTILYTDKIGFEKLKNINYSEIRFFPEDKLKLFPKEIWSMGKLLAVSLINEPFLHFDMDLFITKKINENIFENNDAIFLYEEIWSDIILESISLFFEHKSPININNFRSYNCAIFGGKNYLVFNKICAEICNFIISNRKFFNEKILNFFKLNFDSLYIPMLIEQLWLPSFLKSEGLNIYTLLNNENIKNLTNKTYNFPKEDINNIFLHKNYYGKYIPFYKDIFCQYSDLLSKEAKKYGVSHYHAHLKDRYKSKIINLVKNKNIKY